MNLTLEERERRAFITNSPDHSLILEALEGDEEVRADLEHEKEEVERLDKLVSEANDAAEEAEDEVEELRAKAKELEQRIHDAGVDLVA